MNARQISYAIVSAEKQKPSTKRSLNCDDQIKAIDNYFAALDFFDWNNVPASCFPTLVGTSSARNGQALAGRQTMAVADKLQRRGH